MKLLTNSSRHNPNCVMSWIIAHCNNPANKNSIMFFIFHQINRQNIFQDLFVAPALFFNPAIWSKPNLFLNLIFQSWFVKQSKRRICIYHRVVYWSFCFSIAFVFVQFSFDPYMSTTHHVSDPFFWNSFQCHPRMTTSQNKQQPERTHQCNIATWFSFAFNCFFASSWTCQCFYFTICDHFI